MLQKQIQKRYEGFLQTPSLWFKNSVASLQQFEISSKITKFTERINENQRLGKYIERFVSFQIQQKQNCTIIAENIQIQHDKITLGEIDCLFLKNRKPIHLEIVYKFYVYDPSLGTDEISCFIGPNRKDSLIEKLNKLTKKQLPLLYFNETKNYLKKHDLTAEKFTQEVYFKAQLFVPYASKELKLTKLNSSCISGFYINTSELATLNACKFYIPCKKDWLIVPHKNVTWLNITDFELKAFKFLDKFNSPLCWIKFKNGELKKFFLVWW